MIIRNNNETTNDAETGLAIKNSYVAKSGFNYMTGIRHFENLKIVEGVTKGTASIFLTSLMVFDSNNILIFDGDIQHFTSYSRERVRQLILDGLIKMLVESCEQEGKFFDELEAYEMLDKKLKLSYYKESYKAVLGWAEKVGITIY